MTHRLVVPSTFFPVLRAEHTTAILLCFKLGLRKSQLAMIPFSRAGNEPYDGLRNICRKFAHRGASVLLAHPVAAAVVLDERIGSSGGRVKTPIGNSCIPHFLATGTDDAQLRMKVVLRSSHFFLQRTNLETADRTAGVNGAKIDSR